MSINDLPTGDSQPSPFRRTGFLVTLGFLVLVIIMGVAVVVTHGSGKSGTPGAGPSADSTQPTTTSSPAKGNACGLPGTDQTVPTAPPPNTTWKIYDTVALPFSTTDGPGVVSGDVARCYTHTPTGALLAAAQISARYLISDDWRSVVKEQVMPGIGRDTYSKLRAQITDNTNQPGDYGQTAGFQFLTYVPSTAVIEFVSRFTNGTLQMVTTTVKWSDGDWKIQLQDNGSVAPNAQQVANLSGFITWGGI